MYKLHVLPNNEWLSTIDREYTAYKASIKPRAAAVTFLVYSGISYAGGDSKYFPEQMADSYANAFQIHQKPIQTAVIHKKYIRQLPYLWYLLLVAMPVDIYAHIYQFIFGERDAFLEGGAFFIPYMCSHWTLLSVAMVSSLVHDFIPPDYWFLYFYLLRMNLVIHEHVYRFTLRKMSICYRLFEFGLFMCAVNYFLLEN
jgi:hypothetical protein